MINSPEQYISRQCQYPINLKPKSFYYAFQYVITRWWTENLRVIALREAGKQVPRELHKVKRLVSVLKIVYWWRCLKASIDSILTRFAFGSSTLRFHQWNYYMKDLCKQSFMWLIVFQIAKNCTKSAKGKLTFCLLFQASKEVSLQLANFRWSIYSKL